jgi:hypothetical protein
MSLNYSRIYLASGIWYPASSIQYLLFDCLNIKKANEIFFYSLYLCPFTK